MKVLVCGGRPGPGTLGKYELQNRLNKWNQEFGPITLLITGAAQGSDSYAEQWARTMEIPYVGVPAKWSQWKNQAGPERNGRMLREWRPDVVLAFPGGRGTANMIMQAEASDTKVFRL